MKLWLLKPRGTHVEPDGIVEFDVEDIDDVPVPWNLYGVNLGMVVIAESEADARDIAAKVSTGAEDEIEWLDSSRTSCKEQLLEGKPRILLAQEHGYA